MGLFPILQYGEKKSHGLFRVFKIANFCKNNYEINSVDIQFYHNNDIIPIFQYLYFPVGIIFPMGFFAFGQMRKNPVEFCFLSDISLTQVLN